VRRAELAAIAAAERGLATSYSTVFLSDAAGPYAGGAAPGAQSGRASGAMEDMQRALNLRRIALLAEQDVLTCIAPQSSAPRPVAASWLQHWQRLAPQVDDDSRQRLWVRLLLREMAASGKQGADLLEALARVGAEEVASLRLVAGYSFGKFLFDARARYFEPELHGRWLADAVALGVLRPLGATHALRLRIRARGQEPLLLVCRRHALQLSGLGGQGVELPVLRVTGTGRQLLDLCDGEADMAYLLDVAACLAAEGIRIAVGEWQSQHGHFKKRFDYS
jgi:hypothetical protein